MTDLDLARAIFPAAVRVEERYRRTLVVHMVSPTFEVGSGDDPETPVESWLYFEPGGEHFSDVLAWLLSNHEASVGGEDVTVYAGNQRYEYTPHDGTPAGIRRAVHEAAIRVLEAV
jgi:hypothetical protein